MWVCNCKAVTDHAIRDLLESPFINTVEDVGKACGAGTGCGGCRADIAKLCAEAAEGMTAVSVRTVDRSTARLVSDAPTSDAAAAVAG